MHRASQTLSGIVLALLLLSSTGVVTSAADRQIRGVVTDESGGVLPGVTVAAADADGHVLATAITDQAGRYTLGPLAPGRITLSFQLEGFAAAATPATLGSEADAVVNQRLAVAPQSETVDVRARAPVPFPPPPPTAPPVARPRPAIQPVPEHDRDAVCAPAKLEGIPESRGTVRARRATANGLFGPGDELVIDGGTTSGLAIGQNFVVRRTYRIAWDPRTEIGEHSAGLVQIVSADNETATAVVVYACDEMMPGDRLAPFHPQPQPAVEAAGKPDYRHPVAILFPDIGLMMGAPRRSLVIDGGARDGVHAGQRVTLFRRRASDGARVIVGEAVVVAARRDSAAIRVERVSDAIFPGDLAALHRE